LIGDLTYYPFGQIQLFAGVFGRLAQVPVLIRERDCRFLPALPLPCPSQPVVADTHPVFHIMQQRRDSGMLLTSTPQLNTAALENGLMLTARPRQRGRTILERPRLTGWPSRRTTISSPFWTACLEIISRRLSALGQ
jgi:hypothetical protein